MLYLKYIRFSVTAYFAIQSLQNNIKKYNFTKKYICFLFLLCFC